jgi:hypothetical protein
MKRCTDCLLPETYPRVRFDEAGRCNACEKYDRKKAKTDAQPSPRAAARKARLKTRMDSLLERKRGKGEYDCLIGFSGGKDSTFLLHLFSKVYGLRVLAYTCDTGFLSDVAHENVRRAIEKLGVDHVWIRPAPELYRRLYAKYLKRPSRRGSVYSVCSRCFNITGLVALRLAVEKRIPIVVYGLSPGQLGFFPGYRIPRWLLTAISAIFKWFPKAFLGVSPSKEEKADLDVPFGDMGKMPDVILPFQALDYDIARNTEAILEMGLIERGKESPVLTNCLINLAMMEQDFQQLGYNPYAGEFSQLFREGQLDKEEWLAVDEAIRTGTFERETIDRVRAELGLS